MRLRGKTDTVDVNFYFHRKVLSKTDFGQSHGYFGAEGESIFGKSYNKYDYNVSHLP